MENANSTVYPRTMPDQKQVRFQFKPQQAYLEMARSVLNLPVRATPEAGVKEENMTPNTLLGLVSLAYVFSFLAIEAFINECLYEFWTRPGSRLPQECPTFEDLLRHPEFCDLKRRIVWACDMYGIEPLSKVDHPLWTGFCQVLRDVRHFLTHPSPEPGSFQRRMELAMQKNPFGKPVSVAEGIISYFYDANGRLVPSWVTDNQEFRIEAIRALSTRPPMDA